MRKRKFFFLFYSLFCLGWLTLGVVLGGGWGDVLLLVQGHMGHP